MSNSVNKHSIQLLDEDYSSSTPLERELFTKHAFLFVANRERILADNRLSHTVVPVRNGLSYSGEIRNPTLGTYVTWWSQCPHSVQLDADGRVALVWFFSGSPLSGANWCSVVYEDGTTRDTRVAAFSQLWSPFMHINQAYRTQTLVSEAYTLRQAVDLLSIETTDEVYRKGVREFCQGVRKREQSQ